MTDGKKATAVLNFLEEQDSTTVINILSPMLDDEALALVYDGLVRDGLIDGDDKDDDPLAEYSEEYRSGIAYVLENMDEDDKNIIRAECNKAYKQHLIPDDNIVDDSTIIFLLDEYGEDNGLPDGWYLEEYDASEILALV